MVTDQPTLFDVETPDEVADDKPKCRLCGSLAGWQPTKHRYGMYCGGYRCVNPWRYCAKCHKRFEVRIGVIKGKYCSDECLWQAKQNTNRRGRPCMWCGNSVPLNTGPMPDVWVCIPCRGLLAGMWTRLNRYHVSNELRLQLRDDPTCRICGTYLLTKIRYSGRLLSQCVIDHDHDCCPESKAGCCGRCVRGFLCISCNLLLGQANEDIDVLGHAAEYLQNWMAHNSIGKA